MVTGHIRKRVTKDGKASYQVILETDRDPSTGKRQRMYRTVNGTKREAEATLTRLKAELSNGNGFLQPSTVKLRNWLDDWMKLYNIHLSPTTQTTYKQQIQTHIISPLGNVPLNILDGKQIQAWVNDLNQKQGLSGKTVKNIFLNLKAALDKAEELQMIPRNPCKYVVLPPIKKFNAQVYSVREVQNILNLAKNTDMYFLLVIEFYLGLRKGEIAELKWSDIDLENGIVYITRSRVGCEDGVIVKSTKSEAGIRDLTLTKTALETFKEEYDKYLENTRKIGFVDSGYVIHQDNGEPFVPSSIPQKWKRFCEQHKLRKIRFHDLRHTCATILIASGVDAKTVQTWLGHSDVQVTLNTYTHCLASMKKAAGDKMEVIFI